MTKTPLTEPTPEGEQGLVPGIAPITRHDRLQDRMAAPIAPKRNPDATQKPCDIGLFSEVARNQCDLIDLLRANDPGAFTPNPSKKD